jgi:hypothetical protein
MAISSRVSLLVISAVFAPLFVRSADAQQSAPPHAPSASSIVEAARATRQHISESVSHPRVITNDHFQARPRSGGSSAYPLPSPAANAQLAALPPGSAPQASEDSGCYNSVAAGDVASQLIAAEDQRVQLQRGLSPQQSVIFGNSLDLRSYQAGYSGIYIGSAPLQESQPPAPARVDLAAINDQIATLKNSLQLACDPPEVATLQSKLNAVNTTLDWSQRELALDQDSFYSDPDYARDTAGQTYLNAQQAYIDALASEEDLLTQQLAALQTISTANDSGAPPSTPQANPQ